MDKLTVTSPELLRSATDTLSRSQKTLEPKWFYDHRGSELFEEITRLKEYYPTRTETAILADNSANIVKQLPNRATLIELGSGASAKTRLLLEASETLSAYAPLDISASFLRTIAKQLRSDYPTLEIVPIVADFMSPFSLPAHVMDRDLVAFFPGSTIGNLEPEDAIALLSRVSALGNVHSLILGADLVKDSTILIDAYDDAAGVTAAFNKNLLYRLNREAGGTFEPDSFLHEARWNEDKLRIEMHLVSQKAQVVELGNQTISFVKGESIHTENSHKYTQASLSEMADAGGWNVVDWMTDPAEMFSVSVLKPN